MKKRVFVKNAAILTVTSLILRTIGMFFRVYLAGRLTAEGMGLYQLILSVYMLASTFAASGITTAVTRLVADALACKTGNTGRIMRRAILLSVGIGAASGILILLTADPIGLCWIADMRAVPAIRIMACALPFLGISSCIKGYFVARRKVSCPSRAQILEQLVRIGVIMLLIDRFSAGGIASACAAVMLGDVSAEAASCLYLIIGFRLDRKHLPGCDAPGGRDGMLRKLLAIAVPITAGRYLTTGLRTIENLLIPSCLESHSGSREESLATFGKLKGMALPLIFFPASFLSAFSTLLLPEMSEALALGQKRRVASTVSRTVRITLLASYLVGGLFLLFAYPLCELIYHDAEVGFLLSVLAPLTPLMYLESVVDGVLKGLNQQVHSLLYSIADCVSRIAFIWLFVPRFGIYGFLGIMIFSNILTCFLNVRRLLTVAEMRMCWADWMIKPLLAIITACSLVRLLFFLPPLTGASPLVSVIAGVTLVCILYLLLLPLLGCITAEDLRVSKTLSKNG